MMPTPSPTAFRFLLFAAAFIILPLGRGNAADGQGISQDHPWGTIRTNDTEVKIEFTSAPPSNQITLPRLNNRLKSLVLVGSPDTEINDTLTNDTEIKFTPEREVWLIQLPKSLKYPASLHLSTIEPVRLCEKPFVVQADDQGQVLLPAHHAITHGEKLRFEPQPHKNTVGYWTKSKDWAEWHFETKQSTKFSCEVLQGCGKGQGGSEVELAFISTDKGDPKKQTLSLTIKDTGHFQNFVPRDVGEIELPAGRFRLEVRPTKLAANAIGDIRQIKLTPVSE